MKKSKATAKPAKKASAKTPAKASKRTSPRKSSKKKRPPVVFARTAASSGWRARLREELATTGPDFAAYLRGLGATGWEHADAPELAGLERWGTDLATRDRALGVAALVAAAQYGLPRAVAAGGSDLDELNFRGLEGDIHNASVELQLSRCAAWLDDPSDASFAKVLEVYDDSRQLQIWDDDVRPDDDLAFHWYFDTGQCCCAAITRDGGDPARYNYHWWPPETSVGRGLVVCARGLRTNKTSAKVVNELRKAMET